LPQLSVVVMTYNEAGSLEAVVHEIHQTLEELGRPYEVLIVDDGSDDGSAELADRLAETLPGVRVVHHPVNQGLGGVYRTGFAQARGDWITFFPADGQFPAAIIGQFAPLMDRADMVLGYLPERKRSLLGQALSALERLLYRLLFGPLPRFQGVLMFRRSLLDQFALKSAGRGWAVLMELIIRTSRGGYRVLSVPTMMRPRMSGRSKVNNLRTIWANLRQAIALRRDLGQPGASCAARRWLVVALAGAVAALHLWSLLRFPPPFVDEAWFGARAWALLHTGRPFSTLDAGVFDRFAGYWTCFPLLPAWCQSLGLRLFPTPELLAVRGVSLLFGGILLVGVYFSARRLGGPALGGVSALLTALSWPFFLTAHLGRYDIMAAALGFGALALYLNNGAGRWWLDLLTGLGVGLAFEFHPHSAIYGPALTTLYFLDMRWAMFRRARWWCFVAGALGGLAVYAALHVLPYPATCAAIQRLAFAPTHTPPLLTLDPAVLLRSVAEMGRLLVSSYQPLLPVILCAIVALAGQRSAAGRTLLGLNGAFIGGAILLIRNKLWFYAILFTPALDIAVAAFLLRLLRPPWRRRVRDLLGRALALGLCVGSLALNLSALRTDYGELFRSAQARVEAAVRPGDTIMGLQTFWFGLHDHVYYSWEALVYYQRAAPDSTVEEALAAFRPDLWITDSAVELSISDEARDDSPYSQHLRLSRRELDAVLRQRATLAVDYDSGYYGQVRVYRIEWEER